MTINKNNSEFTEWHDSIANTLADVYNLPITWAKEMVRTLDSMALGYHLGYSIQEFREGQVSAAVAQRAENAERALKEANRRYGIASEKIGHLRAELALLREKNRELVNNPYKIIWTPRVFDDPKVEAPHDLVLRSSKPLWRQNVNETFIIRFIENKKPYVPEGRWWCDPDDDDRYTAMHGDWDHWVSEYGPFIEVIDVAN